MTTIKIVLALAMTACAADPGPTPDSGDADLDAMLIDDLDGQVACRGAECLEPDAGPPDPDAAVALQLGDDCVLLDDHCAPELTCVYTVGRFQCQPHGDAPEDAECESIIGDCDRGLVCVSTGPTKRCRRWCSTDNGAAWCVPEQQCFPYQPNLDYPANAGTCS